MGVAEQVAAMSPQERERLMALAAPRVVDPYFVHIPHPKQQLYLTIQSREALFGGAAGGGKKIEVNTKILTPKGWKRNGDLAVGDMVVNPRTGGSVPVVLAHPVTEDDVWEVEFEDGAVIEAHDEHLWAVRCSGKRNKGWDRRNAMGESDPWLNGYNIITTKMLSEAVARTRRQIKAGVRANYPHVPVNHAVEFTNPYRNINATLPVDPYFLGLLLGDGWYGLKGNLAVCSNDVEIVDWLRAFAAQNGWMAYRHLQKGKPDFRTVAINGCPELKSALWRLGLQGKRSWEKHIPEPYLFAPLEWRTKLMQGLMDTDGYVDDRGHMSYTTTSEKLSIDMSHLARSLGAKVVVTEKVPTYTHNGEKKRGRLAYTVWITPHDPTSFVSLPRKLLRVKKLQNIPTREVVDVRRTDRKAKMRCITVGSVDGLYIAGENYTVTHNSDALLMAASQFVDVPGYSALILRRTWPDLNSPGAILDRARSWWEPMPQVKVIDGGRVFQFPSGARISFGYMNFERDKYKWQSSEFQFCVERSTRIRMGDDSLRRIDAILPGDLVMTLQGPRKVRKVHDVGVRSAVALTTQKGTITASTEHPILTPYGWVSPRVLMSNQSRDVDRLFATYSPSALDRRRHVGYSRLDQMHMPALRQPVLVGSSPVGTLAWTEDDRTDCAMSGQTRLDDLPLQPCSFPAVLYGPEPQSVVPCCCALACARSNGTCDHAVRGCDDGCLPCSGFCDAQSHLVSEDALGLTPSLTDAGQPSGYCCGSDDLDSIQTHTHLGTVLYSHPYTNVVHQSSEVAHRGQVEAAPMGEAYMFDLEVEGASHYVSWNNIIARNCGFDELTQFPESMYTYLFSRVRRPQVSCLNCRQALRYESKGHGAYAWQHADRGSKCPDVYPDPKIMAQYPPSVSGLSIFEVPLRIRAATNPGGVGHDWVKARFLDPKTREKSAFFIPSSLNDNPSLDQESYKENLMHLLPADRERLLNGDWDVFEQGDYFHREWFPVVTEAPKGTTVRFWDRAATLDDGDFTVGTKLTLSAEGRWCVQDVVRGQWSSAGNETVIAQTAAQDGRSVFIRMEQEPGSAGKDVIDYYRRRVLVGYAFDGVPSTGDKRVRATPVSSAAQALNISIMPGEWNRKWLDELSLFPFGANDDQVDSLSGAFKFLSTLRRARILV